MFGTVASSARLHSRREAVLRRTLGSGGGLSRSGWGRRVRVGAAVAALLGLAGTGLVTGGGGVSALPAPVGSGFTVTTSDLAFILKQIKIAERHSRSLLGTEPTQGPNPDPSGDPAYCQSLVGPNPDQIPDYLTSYGLRTVDGECNNLIPNATMTSADGQTTRNNQVAAAEFPVRTQGNPGLFPCTIDPDPSALPDPIVGVPAGCVPSHQTLFIPNVTTDVGLSPPYNSLFTFFGQFFDHGVDQTVKSGGTVFVPLHADDPLITLGPDGKAGTGDEVPPSQAFMVLTRAQNQPGPDNVLGTADDIQNANNTDTPWVDQSQTYTSHPSHQFFLREYVLNAANHPVPTGKLLDALPGLTDADGPATTGSISTWAATKALAAT